nr:GyrI-like domain-containing protein [Maliibacterium massiliense]
MEKLDFKKAYKDLYLPGAAPMCIDVPAMRFIMVDGEGAPEGADYQQALQVLYALSFNIKMSKLGPRPIAGYYEYVVPPLEGLWSCKDGPFDVQARGDWCWTSMIRQPDFVTEDVFADALLACQRKKPDLPIARARFVTWTEGRCVQMLHRGPYADEPVSLAQLHAFMQAQQLAPDAARRHHEIYLSDPRRADPARLRTVLRLPVKRL